MNKYFKMVALSIMLVIAITIVALTRNRNARKKYFFKNYGLDLSKMESKGFYITEVDDTCLVNFKDSPPTIADVKSLKLASFEQDVDNPNVWTKKKQV